MGYKIPFELDPQWDSMYSGVRQMVRRVKREITKPSGGGATGGGGFMQSIFFPKGGKMDKFVGTDIKKTFDKMFRTMGQTIRRHSGRMGKAFKKISAPFDKIIGSGKKMGAVLNTAFKGMKGSIKAVGTELKGMLGLISRNTQALQKMARAAGGMIAGGARRVGRGIKRAGRGAARVGYHALRGAAFAGMMGARGIAGFTTAAFQESIGAYENRSQARLQAAPALMGAGGRTKGFTYGAGLGYNSAQAAGIQAGAARQGMGSGRYAGQMAMEMQRGWGAEMTPLAAGIQRRRGTTIDTKKQLKEAKTEIVRIFGAAIHSGLKTSRMLEFTQATSSFAEKQLAVTPDKDSYKAFAAQLAFVGKAGGAGLRGKYGAAAMGRIDQSIKGAGGAQEAFLNRAFGFGKGASYLDVTRRREAGIGDAKNLPAIMKQMQKETGGAGKYGGLTGAGLLHFKGMGFGSTTMAQKFGEMYLQGGAKGMTPEQQQKKLSQMMGGEADAKLAPLQRRAYKAMGSFGRVAASLAKRFNQFANLGKKWYKIKQELSKAAVDMAKGIAPILSKVMVPIAKGIANFTKTFGPKLAAWLETITASLLKIAGGVSAFFSGYSKGGFRGGAAAASEFYQKNARNEYAQKGKSEFESLVGKGDPRVASMLKNMHRTNKKYGSEAQTSKVEVPGSEAQVTLSPKEVAMYLKQIAANTAQARKKEASRKPTPRKKKVQ